MTHSEGDVQIVLSEHPEVAAKLIDEMDRAGRDYMRLREVEAENTLLKGAMAAQDERERIAGERCGVPYEIHTCDWPEWVADEVLALRAERDEWKRRAEATEEQLSAKDAEIAVLRKQMAAMTADRSAA